MFIDHHKVCIVILIKCVTKVTARGTSVWIFTVFVAGIIKKEKRKKRRKRRREEKEGKEEERGGEGGEDC